MAVAVARERRKGGRVREGWMGGWVIEFLLLEVDRGDW